MSNARRVFLLLTAGMVSMVGRAWSDTVAAVTPTAVVAAKPAKGESPTMTAMKAAIALAEAGKTDEAVAAYEKIGVLKSKKMEAWRLNNEALAYLQAATPAPVKAVPLLEKSVATDAGNYVAWNNLGSAYEQTDQLEKAKDAYQKSIDAAKDLNASSAKAEGNLQSLQPRLDKLAAKSGDDKPDADDSAAGADKNK